MSIKIKYAYLQHHTWMYRRHFPKDVQVMAGHSKSLSSSDNTSHFIPQLFLTIFCLQPDHGRFVRFPTVQSPATSGGTGSGCVHL